MTQEGHRPSHPQHMLTPEQQQWQHYQQQHHYRQQHHYQQQHYQQQYYQQPWYHNSASFQPPAGAAGYPHTAPLTPTHHAAADPSSYSQNYSYSQHYGYSQAGYGHSSAPCSCYSHTLQHYYSAPYSQTYPHDSSYGTDSSSNSQYYHWQQQQQQQHTYESPYGCGSHQGTVPPYTWYCYPHQQPTSHSTSSNNPDDDMQQQQNSQASPGPPAASTELLQGAECPEGNMDSSSGGGDSGSCKSGSSSSTSCGAAAVEGGCPVDGGCGNDSGSDSETPVRTQGQQPRPDCCEARAEEHLQQELESTQTVCCRLRAQLAAEHRQQRYILTCCEPAIAPSIAGDSSSGGSSGSSSGSSDSSVEEGSPANVHRSADLPPLGSAGSVLLLRRAAIVREQRLLQQVADQAQALADLKAQLDASKQELTLVKAENALLQLQLGQAGPQSEPEHTQGGLSLQHQQKQPLLVLQQHEEVAAFTCSGSVSPMGSIEQPTTPDASSLAAAPVAAGCTAGLRGLILPEHEPSADSTERAGHQHSWAGLKFGSWGMQADTPAESGTVAAGTLREDAVLQEQLPLSRNVCRKHSSSSSSSEALQFGSVGSGETGTNSNTTGPEADAMQRLRPSRWLAPAVGGAAVEQPGQTVALACLNAPAAAAAEAAKGLAATALHSCQVGSEACVDICSPAAVPLVSSCSMAESGSFVAGSPCGPAGGVLLEVAGAVLQQQQQQMLTGSSSTGAQQQPAWAVPQFGAFDDSMLD